MILAGLDEAGYGPLLGPLVVGFCAFEVEPKDGDHDIPCIWKRLSSLVSKKRSATGRKLHINDSKLVYSPSEGLKELERSVLAVLCASTMDSAKLAMPDRFHDLLQRTAADVLRDLDGYPWYGAPADERFPLEQDALPIRLMANALRSQMDRNGTHCVHLSARVILERQLNQQLAVTRNKASVLFSTSAIHLDYLLRTFGHKPMTIVCDRQGGREHYGSLLRLMFEEWTLEITLEQDGYAEYHLCRGEHSVRIIFREKAEAQCLPVAMASMLSKYLREGLMRRFNAFWVQHLPQVTPTAGYYNDGTRFLRDIEPKRQELGISDEQLIRSR
jgi:hypothetical protein